MSVVMKHKHFIKFSKHWFKTKRSGNLFSKMSDDNWG